MLRSLLPAAGTPRCMGAVIGRAAATAPLPRVAARSLHASAVRAVIPVPPHKPKREWVGGPVSSRMPPPIPPPPSSSPTPDTPAPAAAPPRRRRRLWIGLLLLVAAVFGVPVVYTVSLVRRLYAAEDRAGRDAVWDEFIAQRKWTPEQVAQVRELQARSQLQFEQFDELKKRRANGGK